MNGADAGTLSVETCAAGAAQAARAKTTATSDRGVYMESMPVGDLWKTAEPPNR